MPQPRLHPTIGSGPKRITGTSSWSDYFCSDAGHNLLAAMHRRRPWLQRNHRIGLCPPGSVTMASITIRNLQSGRRSKDPSSGSRLRQGPVDGRGGAADPGRGVDQETVPAGGLGTAIHELFKPFGSVELELPPREPMREPPRFE